MTGTAVDGMRISVQQYSFHCATGQLILLLFFSAGMAQVWYKIQFLPYKEHIASSLRSPNLVIVYGNNVCLVLTSHGTHN